ncbi:MAG: ZIP family metal transporter [Halobacteria archaeon]
MAEISSFFLVFVSGLITALATGLGALPFYVREEFHDRGQVFLWGLASGIMLSASVFGLVTEGLVEGTPLEVGLGAFLGVLLVLAAERFLEDAKIDPRKYREADFKKLVLILGILTVHSFPEGVAIGVSFADLNLESGLHLAGFTVPVLAVFMTVAISVHNIPEGLAVSIPLKNLGIPRSRMVWWAVFSSLPQPIGAVTAFYFVRLSRQLLPAGFGFAAGAMVFLVLTDFIPEALETGEELPDGGRVTLGFGIVVGFGLMLPLAFVGG